VEIPNLISCKNKSIINFYFNMKIIFILIYVFLITTFCFSQSNSVSSKIDTTVYAQTDTLPSFPGGDSLMAIFISKNFIYSKSVLESGLVATTLNFNFIITETGKIKNIKVNNTNERTKNLGFELVRVLELMPAWIPGRKNGRDASVMMLYSVKVSNGFGLGLYNISYFNNLKLKTDSLYNSGVEKSKIGNLQGALEDFTEVLKFNSGDIDALYNRGIMKFKLKDTKGACDDWTQIKDLNRKDADALLKKYCHK